MQEYVLFAWCHWCMSAQAQRRIALPAEYFTVQLKRHVDPELRRKPTRKLLADLEPSFDVLKKLEVCVWVCVSVCAGLRMRVAGCAADQHSRVH